MLLLVLWGENLNMNKLMSIIMPVKNGSNYMQQALDGIKKQNMNVEVIVVDDCSDDDTSKIALDNGCKLIRHETTKGQVAAKNSGLMAASGSYIMFHDHDDIMNDGALKTLYDTLEENADISLAMAKVKDFVSPDCADVTDTGKIEAYWGLFTGAVLIRKEVFDKVGYFEESLNTGEIISLQSKMDGCGLKSKKIDFISTQRRIHNSNYGKTNREKEFKDYLSVLRMRMRMKNK